jgi:hypothetical protein
MKPHFDHKTMLVILLRQCGKTLKQFQEELEQKYHLSQLKQGSTVRQTFKSKGPDGTPRWADKIHWSNDRWMVTTTKHGRITQFVKNPLAKHTYKTTTSSPQITIKKRRTIQ